MSGTAAWLRFFRGIGLGMLLGLVLVWLCGCSHIPFTKTPREKLEQGYTRFEGPLVTRVLFPAQDRIFLYVWEDGAGVKVIAGENDNNFDVLKDLNKSLEIVIGEDVTVWGRAVDGSWREYTEGVYMEMHAIAWYDPVYKVEFIINTRYGDKVMDQIDSGEALKLLLKTGWKAVKP